MRDPAKYGLLLASAETLMSNIVTNTAARYIGNAGFAKISLQTIYKHMNLSAWQWEENDRFYVNQAGHPYQGSTYFNSGRSNGFSFYESTLFTAAGSALWEFVFENGICSLNDFVTTIIGGSAVGEMLHRLFAEFDGNGTIRGKMGSTLASPMDRLTALLTSRKPSADVNNFYDISFAVGLGWIFADFRSASRSETWSIPNMFIDTRIVYGNPFEQDGYIPYQQFELSAFIAGGAKSVEKGTTMWYDSRIVSDGCLFAFSHELDNSKTSTGLTLHFDYFNLTDDIADNAGFAGSAFSADSLDWTVKYRLFVDETAFFEVKAHAGWLVWGTSTYWSNVLPGGGVISAEYYNHYGTGINMKLFLTFSSFRWGILRMNAMAYLLYGWGGDGGNGIVSYAFTDSSYSIRINKQLSLGVGWSFAYLGGWYDRAPDGHKWTKTGRIFSEWRL
ncbi:MAG: DUF3943 domain-containing protein [Treponema sp.]|jgi:hypothetical protein|nr:DUF3943 domain-containing protein [Treponema sp.]